MSWVSLDMVSLFKEVLALRLTSRKQASWETPMICIFFIDYTEVRVVISYLKSIKINASSISICSKCDFSSLHVVIFNLKDQSYSSNISCLFIELELIVMENYEETVPYHF